MIELYPKPAGLFCPDRGGNLWALLQQQFYQPGFPYPTCRLLSQPCLQPLGLSVVFTEVPASAGERFVPGHFAACQTLPARPAHSFHVFVIIAGVGKSDIEELEQLSREAVPVWAEAGSVVCWCIRTSLEGVEHPCRAGQARGAERGAQALLPFYLSVKLLGKFRFCGRGTQKRGTDL